MKIIDTTPHWTGRLGKKTKGLKAKPLVNLIVDKSVMSKFLLDTLEAKEVLTPDACFCIGQANDAWQQATSKLLKDYDLTGIDADGWMLWHPKPTKIVEFIEVDQAFLDTVGALPAEELYIVGLWGSVIGVHRNLQRLHLGDFIARQRDVHEDQWVVAKSIWQRTYTEIAAC